MWTICKAFIEFVTILLLLFMFWVFFFFFWILAPEPEIKPSPSTLEGKALTTGSPGMSPECTF